MQAQRLRILRQKASPLLCTPDKFFWLLLIDNIENGTMELVNRTTDERINTSQRITKCLPQTPGSQRPSNASLFSSSSQTQSMISARQLMGNREAFL
jgi:hypothetical protein